jgi:hypothetical protein
VNLRLTNPLLWRVCAISLLALLGWVLCQRLSHPWTYNDDYNGAFWAEAARNLSRAGFVSSAGVPAPLYFGSPPIPADALYVHHPTLLADMMYLDRALLGESESAARLLPILFSLLAAGLLFQFASIHTGPRPATFILAFFVAAPMELHYGQMVNFEAPELFFILAALCAFHRWRSFRDTPSAALLIICCALALWTDWQGYLLVIILVLQLFIESPARNSKICAALLSIAFLSGCAFLLQIHIANPSGWSELLRAFRERSGHADLSGSSFTIAQWLGTQFIDLTTLFNPIALLLAICGAFYLLANRRGVPVSQRPLFHIAGTFFIIDFIYVCALRNQSYIHDFASFYFLIPAAIFPGLLIEHFLARFKSPSLSIPATAAAGIIAAALIVAGIRRLDNIDTQFCILGDDDTEPATLMPDVGRVIDQNLPVNRVILCNFDKYYSPLPYYARHIMTNDLQSYAGWRQGIADALPQSTAGIIWSSAPGAADLLRHLPQSETRPITVDGIPFTLWLPK